MTQSYADLKSAIDRDPVGFWGGVAKDLSWDRAPDEILSEGHGPIPRWFTGGELNACYNCVDRHVETGRGDDTALIYESPVTDVSRVMTFAELKDATAKLGGALGELGIGCGDRVLIYMPNGPEALIAMLACARIGAAHSVVFGGFAAPELAARIDDATPGAIIAASCGIEGGRVLPYQPIIDDACARATHQPAHHIYFQRPQQSADLSGAHAHDWTELVKAAVPAACVPVAATDPLYILYTSGTTGKPKGVVRDTGGYLAALSWSMRGIYDCGPGDVFWAASDVGWVVGHSYMAYGPLLAGCATLVFEGKPVGTPDEGIFWRLIEKHGVRAFFTAPTAIRAIRRVDPEGKFLQRADLSKLQSVFLAGERTDPATLDWTERMTGKPVIDHWWQTETGWPICAVPLGTEVLPVKPGSTALPMPGWQIECLDPAGKSVAAGESGALAARLPLPPGAAPTLWNADDRYREAYLDQFAGYYTSGDAGYIDEDGYVFVMTRMDDVINVAGHRLSSSAMEEVLGAHADVAECAVVGVADELKGQVPVGFVVANAGATASETDLERQLVADVRAAIGPVAALKRVHLMPALPKTRSGKVLRRTIRQIADGDTVEVPATIEDRAVLDAFHTKLGAGV